MKQKDKEILLKVLYEQLSYGVLILDTATEKYGKIYQINPDFVWYDCQETGDVECQTIFNVKPYLFPFSSMTEEQEKEYYATFEPIVGEDGRKYFLMTLKSYDWLNKNHIDYRGLIDKGLAIDATGLNIY